MLSLLASLMLQVSAPASPPAAPPSPAAPEFQVELRDGRTLRGVPQAVQAERLTLVTAAGTEAVALDDVVLLEAVPAPVADLSGPAAPADADGEADRARPPDLLFLAPPDGAAGPGDRLVGELLGGDSYGLRFAVPDVEPFTVRFEAIERLLPRADRPVDRLAQLESGGQDDRLWRRGADGSLDHLDSLTGVVDRVEAGKLVFEGALGTLSFDLHEVLAVVFAPGGSSQPQPAGRPVVVRLASGSRFLADLLGIEDGAATLATRWSESLRVPLPALAALVPRGPQRTLLAELPPAVTKEWPSIGAPEDFLFPWRADLSVTGQLLSVGGIPRATGLGVHSNCELTFAIPPGADTLRVTVGLSDEVSELPVRGSVTCEVRVDGQRRAASAVLHAGDPPAVLRVSGLKGARELQLVTGDGGDDDAGDRAAWVDGVLLTAGS